MMTWFLGLFVCLASLAMVKTSVLSSRDTTRITADEIEEKLGVISPLLFVMNTFVMEHDRHACVEKMFCVFESQFPVDVNNPMKYFGKLLANTDGDLGDEAYQRMKELVSYYPYLERVVGGIEYGRVVTNSSMCEPTFPECSISVGDMVSELNVIHEVNTGGSDNAQSSGLGNDFLPRVKRGAGTCAVVGVSCGVVSIGCIACSFFTFGTCAIACAGLTTFCSTTGIGCAVAPF